MKRRAFITRTAAAVLMASPVMRAAALVRDFGAPWLPATDVMTATEVLMRQRVWLAQAEKIINPVVMAITDPITNRILSLEPIKFQLSIREDDDESL